MTKPSEITFLFSCLILLLPFSTKAQIGNVDQDTSNKPTLVILGTYHMAKTSSNVINRQITDVTSPERQAQIADLIEQLAEYNPTKIALECDIEDSAKIQSRYQQFLSGNYQLSRNEIDQIGLRLAKTLNHENVYCVDWGIFPADPLYNYETYAEKDSSLNHFLKERYQELRTNSDEETKKLSRLTVTEQLIHLNETKRIEQDHRGYFELLRIGKGDEYVGANYLSWWYGRNMKILVNIMKITGSPNDRILVVYGSGHNKLLNQLAKESGFYSVKSPLKYLQK